jgi:hypothetical protein
LRWLESVEEGLKKMCGCVELETSVAGPRTVEDNFRGVYSSPSTVMPEDEEEEGNKTVYFHPTPINYNDNLRKKISVTQFLSYYI